MSASRERDAPYDLDSKYEIEDGRIYLTGVQALVRLPMDQMRADRRAGLRTQTFISGYPGSPLGDYDLELSRNRALLDGLGILHRPGMNEELAATAVMGSQQAPMFGRRVPDGVLGIWYGKSPGVDRASDALRHANFVGTTRTSGALVLAGDDPSCKSSSVPNASEAALADLAMPVLAPGSSQEVLDLGRHGVALSRASALWVGLKIVASIADGAGTAEVGPDRIRPVLPRPDDGASAYGRDLPAGLSPLQIIEVEREIHEVRLEAARRYLVVNRVNEVTHRTSRDRVGIVAGGHLYHLVMEALRRLGVDEAQLEAHGIRMLHLRALHPFTPTVVRDLAEGLEEIVVVEEKRANIEVLVRDALYGTSSVPLVVGKQDETGARLLPEHGAIDTDVLLRPLAARLARVLDPATLTLPRERIPLAMVAPPRTPYFCSGCPHNTSLRVPEGALVGAGIGCHSMVAFLDEARSGKVTGVTQMGGEGAQWIGAAPFVEADHMTQNLGDGTFFHSGQLAVQAAVAAGSNITYKILYNRAVAMTGGQDVPGQLDVPAMASVLAAQGVGRIIVTTEDRSRYRGVALPANVQVWDRNRIVEAQDALRNHGGVTVLIHDQQCAAEARRLRKRGLQPDPPMRVAIAPRVCEGCGDCGVQSNCLSLLPVETAFGTKTEIDQSSCNKDYSCIQGDCPSFLTLRPARTRRIPRTRPPTSRPEVVAPDIPEPSLVVSDDDYLVRMTGIGGTGVVTVSQILGTAATLDGKHVAGLDQTGLAQKGGGVVSDLRIARHSLDDAANKAGAGGADLYLVFDVLVGLSPANLAAASPERTVAVVATTKVPTGQMIGRPSMAFPADSVMQGAIAAQTRSAPSAYIDPAAIVVALFGRKTSANVFLLGVAYQLGAIPVQASSIERAIDLNGVAVDANLQAFRWGRLWVHDRRRVEDAMHAAAGPGAAPSAATAAIIGDLMDSALRQVLVIRVGDLIGYQGSAYATRYMEMVRRVADAERAVDPSSRVLADAVARNLYKLMAYKDEYEVARLLLADLADVADRVPGGAEMEVWFNLHPPLLRALGLGRKIRFGAWSRPLFRVLAAGKALRGTPLDAFGYTKVRRVERRLVRDYVTGLDEGLRALGAQRLPVLIELASLPDMVRGYEHVKLRSVEHYDDERQRLLRSLRG